MNEYPQENAFSRFLAWRTSPRSPLLKSFELTPSEGAVDAELWNGAVRNVLVHRIRTQNKFLNSRKDEKRIEEGSWKRE